MEGRLLSAEEVADYLRVKRDTVYKLIARKGMPARRVGRLWRFRLGEIDDWIDSGRAGSRRTRASTRRRKVHSRIRQSRRSFG